MLLVLLSFHVIFIGGFFSSCRHLVFICRLPSGRDFNRRILRSLNCSCDKTGARKENDEQQKRLSHGGRRRYRSQAFLQSQNRFALRSRELASIGNWISHHWIGNAEIIGVSEPFRSRKPAIC